MTRQPPVTRIRARFVVPVDAPVIENGVVEMRDGRITEVGRWDGGANATDMGDVAILPGFVNAHTHLELSDLAGQVAPTSDFCDWLRRVVSRTGESRTISQVDNAVRIGMGESIQAGVTTIGDITRFPAVTRSVLKASALRVVSFGEIAAIGNRRHLLADRLAAAAATDEAGPRLRIGLSPHSPYTVEPSAMRKIARLAEVRSAPLCIHAAETAEEDQFTRCGNGPLADFLRSIQVWDDRIPVSRCGPVALLHATGLLTPRTVLAHANYVTDVDVKMIAESGVSVAYCPRTHAAFGHPPHRFRDMLAHGINVCIGTDSLASNPSLSILEELRFLRRQAPDVSAGLLIKLGTLNGALALGLGSEVGSLAIGKTADLVALHPGVPHAAAWDSFLDSDKPPFQVWIAGHAQLSAGPGF